MARHRGGVLLQFVIKQLPGPISEGYAEDGVILIPGVHQKPKIESRLTFKGPRALGTALRICWRCHTAGLHLEENELRSPGTENIEERAPDGGAETATLEASKSQQQNRGDEADGNIILRCFPCKASNSGTSMTFRHV